MCCHKADMDPQTQAGLSYLSGTTPAAKYCLNRPVQQVNYSSDLLSRAYYQMVIWACQRPPLKPDVIYGFTQDTLPVLKSERLRVKGEMINAFEIEESVLLHPAIKDAAQ